MILAAGLLAASYVSGDLQAVIDGDTTGVVVWAIGALGLFGTIAARKRRAWLRWICAEGVCTILGLFGTVVGFMIALAGITGDIQADKLGGIETALVTTAAGIIVHIWLLLVREFTRE